MIHSRYRNLIRPIKHFVAHLEKEHPDRQVAVIIPELVKTTWWHYILHNRRAAQLRSALDVPRPDLARSGSVLILFGPAPSLCPLGFRSPVRPGRRGGASAWR